MADPPASKKPKLDLRENKANIMLEKAAKGKYGIAGVCCYNIEGLLATVRAAESRRSPAMILLFPWAQSYSGAALASAASSLARSASVPITLHLDHAQTPEAIRAAAETGCYDSIMVDMSHHEKEENLQMTKELTSYCHERGIVTEAEPGRIVGGEDGVADTKELEAVMTSPEEAMQFAQTGIDWLAPAFGNVHGNYGPRGIQLDYERLGKVNEAVGKEGVKLALHGTDGFDEEIYGKCIQGGITKVNINGIMNKEYTRVRGEMPEAIVTELMEKGTDAMQKAVETCMDMLGSSGKA